jgi:thioredoxin
MNNSLLNVLLGLLLTIVGASGCTDGGAYAFRQQDPHDVPEMVAEAEVIQQSAINAVESAPTPTVPTTLVSTAPTAPQPVQPSLITLPRGGDLNAKISGASGPVLLDFFADWCGPCRTQGKILHDLEGAAAKSQTLIIKINVDEHPQLAKELRVSSLPTLMMIKNGRIVERQTGVANKSRLVAWMR